MTISTCLTSTFNILLCSNSPSSRHDRYWGLRHLTTPTLILGIIRLTDLPVCSEGMLLNHFIVGFEQLMADLLRASQ